MASSVFPPLNQIRQAMAKSQTRRKAGKCDSPQVFASFSDGIADAGTGIVARKIYGCTVEPHRID
jgi:hypothetical protein